MARLSLSALAELPENRCAAPSSDLACDSAIACPRGIREIDRLVESLVASWHSSAQLRQNRRWHRTPYRKPVVITPLDDIADTPIAEPHLAFGRDLAAGGLSFLHEQPLPHRIVAVTFSLEADMATAVVTRLTWCRFTRRGTYQSGGKFLRTIDLPELQELDLDALPAA